MNLDASLLDYIWRGLIAGVVTSLIVIAVFQLARWFFRNQLSAMQRKYFLNAQLVSLFVTFWLSFFGVACVDPELASGCFAVFAKNQGVFTMTRLLAAGWMLMMVLLVLFDAFRILRGATPTSRVAGDLQNHFSALAKNFHLSSGQVQLRTASSAAGPYAVFGRKGLIVLPEAMTKMSFEKLMPVLAHELVHVRDRDSWWKYLDLLCQRVLFFNPVVYWQSRQHHLSLETAADAEAVRISGVSRKYFVETLLEALDWKIQGPHIPLALGVSRDYRETKIRIMALLSSTEKPTSPWIKSGIYATALLATGLSVAQAHSSIKPQAMSREPGLMCSQVQHEKLIESWLQREAPMRSEARLMESGSQCE